MRVPCACAYLPTIERSCTWRIKHQSPLLTLQCTRRCLWTWHSAPGSMLSSPTMLKNGWILLLLCWCWSNAWTRASAEVEGGPAYVRYVSPFEKGPTRQPKKKWQLHQLCSLNVSPEKLIVWLTFQRSYPTSHSCTLNSSNPGITFRSLTVVRNISFSVSSLDNMQPCASAESVILLCEACNDVSEHAYLVHSSVLVDGEE